MKISVTSPSFSKNEILEKELSQNFPNYKINKSGLKLTEKSLIDFIDDSDGVIIGLEKVDKYIIDNLSNLKIIAKYGVGLDNIDIDYCNKKNINIGWTPGVNKLSVAEMALSYMIMLLRNIYITSNKLKSNKWEKDGGTNLSNKTIGIIGVGYIGKELIRLLKPFNCNILVNDIIDQREYYQKNNLTETSKEYIFNNADIITIHTPLTENTYHLINKSTLNKMKKNAFLINSARGGIVNSEDLYWALQSKIIAGAALDVYEEEPPSNKEFLSLPNLITTPHIGGNSFESILAMGRSAIKHLEEFFLKK